MKDYRPPFTITNEILTYVSSVSEGSEQLSEYVKRILDVMEYDTPYTAAALLEKLGLKSKEILSSNSDLSNR